MNLRKNAFLETLGKALFSACLITAMASCSSEGITDPTSQEDERNTPLNLKEGSCTAIQTRTSAIIDSSTISYIGVVGYGYNFQQGLNDRAVFYKSNNRWTLHPDLLSETGWVKNVYLSKNRTDLYAFSPAVDSESKPDLESINYDSKSINYKQSNVIRFDSAFYNGTDYLYGCEYYQYKKDKSRTIATAYSVIGQDSASFMMLHSQAAIVLRFTRGSSYRDDNKLKGEITQITLNNGYNKSFICTEGEMLYDPTLDNNAHIKGKTYDQTLTWEKEDGSPILTLDNQVGNIVTCMAFVAPTDIEEAECDEELFSTGSKAAQFTKGELYDHLLKIKLMCDDQEMTAYTNKVTKWEAGKRYFYNIRVIANALWIDNVYVDDWIDGTVDGQGSGEGVEEEFELD